MNHRSRHGRSRSMPGDQAHRGATLDALWEACVERFLPPEYCISREDSTGTVWVSLGGHSYAIGLRPNMVDRKGLDVLLEDTGERLLAATASEFRAS